MLPFILNGSPGSGKTAALLEIVDKELENGIPPDRIGFISFTKRAAEEARDRAIKKFNLKARQLPWFRTIHSLCFAALGLNSSEVMDSKKIKEFGDWIGVDISGKVNMEDGTSFGFAVGDRCLFMENLARIRRVPLRQQYEEDSDNLLWPLVERVSEGLAEFKTAKHLVDFTDMLQMFVETEWSARLEVLIVDEGQDLSLIQWSVVEKLAKGARRVVVAGDDDQAIYRWAGAAVEHFIALPGDVRVLGQSWRVPEAPQGVATRVLSRVRNRRPKSWHPRQGSAGIVKRVGRLDDLDVQPGDDVLILARNTCFLQDDVAPFLRSSGVLYEQRGSPSVKHSVIGAILDWERLRRGEAVRIQDARALYEQLEVGVGFMRGYKKLPGFTDDAMVTMQHLQNQGGLTAPPVPWYDALTRVSAEDRTYMLKALRRSEKITRRPTVKISTIHGSKGGEADHVILLKDVSVRTYKETERYPEDEARVWYVGATRARERLTIVESQSRREYDV